MTLEFHLHTDTATLAIFDTQAIRHRLDDTCDWWSLPHDELLEITKLWVDSALALGDRSLRTMDRLIKAQTRRAGLDAA